MKLKIARMGSVDVELNANDLAVIRRALDQLNRAGDTEAAQLLHEIDVILKNPALTGKPLP